MERFVERTGYLNKLNAFKEKNLIKVITGIRRSGKSVLMEQFQERLKKDGVQENQIISVNLERLANEELLDYKKLHDYILSKCLKDKWTYVFLDEIQLVKDFQKAVNSLRAEKNIDIYVTGSNSSLLSGELATLLTGRCITIHVLPLSFKEFTEAKASEQTNVDRVFDEYLKNGGFPQTLQLNSQKNIEDYLNDVYSAIIHHDILGRGESVKEGVLTGIAKFIFHGIGNESSPAKITNTLKSNKREEVGSYNTAEKYLGYLKDAFIIYEANFYDVKGKQLLKKNAKYYVVDTGFRNMLLANRETDLGHVLENVIYLELLRRGYKISVGKVDAKEVDFVAENEEGIEYYQVAASVLDPNTLARELEPLNAIKDHFPKYLVTLDNYSDDKSWNGIKVINAIDFLLK